mgnify:FL=1
MIPENTVLCIVDFEATGVDLVRDIPIEVACICVDHNLRVLQSYDTLVRHPDLHRFTSSRDWIGRAKDSHEIHKIPSHKVWGEGESVHQVAVEITSVCDSVRPHKGRVVLTSDCVVFEWAFMHMLFTGTGRWPFHYCAWDTSLLFEMLGIDETESSAVHRALGDAQQLLQHMRKAKKLIDNHEVIPL